MKFSLLTEQQQEQMSLFFSDLQQPTKKLSNPDYFKTLEVLDIKEDLVINRNAKISIRKRTRRTVKPKGKRKLFRQKESSTKKPVNYLQKNPRTPEVVSKLQRKTELSKRRRTGSLSTNKKKLLELKYTKGPAAYGSVKNLQRITNLKPSKVKLFLEGKNAHTMPKNYRIKFPTLKAIAYDINEIWSLDLAHVDKLAKENKDVKYLLVAVDCLSRYLRVDPLKSKYATTTADAFKKMIRNRRPKKVWVDAGTELKGSFSTLCQKNKIEVYKTFSEKKSTFAERKIRSLKNLI